MIDKGVEEIIYSLSPIERKVLPYLNEGTTEGISEKSGLDLTSVKRALQFLSKKDILKLVTKEKKKVLLDENGKIYLNEGLPETRLLKFLEKNKGLLLSEKKKSGLNDRLTRSFPLFQYS